MRKSLLIGIAGISGSGKSRFTTALKKELGERMCLIVQDDYYLDFSIEEGQDRDAVNYDIPSAIDFDLLIEHIEQLSKRELVDIPTYDFSTHSRNSRTQQKQPADFIVVEGTMIYSNAKLNSLFDFSIFVDTPMDIAIVRRMVRDIVERGRDPKEVRDRYLTSVRPGAFQHILAYKGLVDKSISGEFEVLDYLPGIKEQLEEKYFQKS